VRSDIRNSRIAGPAIADQQVTVLNKFEIQPGNEVRGFMVRLYPNAQTEVALETISADMRRAWNWLVKQTEDVLEAREAYAVRHGLVASRLARPNYDGLEPAVAHATKETFIKACVDRKTAIYKATKDIPECSFREFKDILNHFGFKYDMLDDLFDGMERGTLILRVEDFKKYEKLAKAVDNAEHDVSTYVPPSTKR
jgi:hypothetical protein